MQVFPRKVYPTYFSDRSPYYINESERLPPPAGRLTVDSCRPVGGRPAAAGYPRGGAASSMEMLHKNALPRRMRPCPRPPAIALSLLQR